MGGLLAYFWVSGTQFCLKSSSIRLHVSFPLRPKWTSDSFWTGQDGSKSKKNTKNRERFKKNAFPHVSVAVFQKLAVFCGKMDDFRDKHGYRPASRAKHPDKPKRYTLTSCNVPTTWVPPPEIKKARGCNCKFF